MKPLQTTLLTIPLFFSHLENAFPRVWRLQILKFLQQYGLRDVLLTFTENYLHSRFSQVRVTGQLSSVHPQQNGIPQGSLLSGTLFLVAINDVISVIPRNITPILFADDLSIQILTEPTASRPLTPSKLGSPNMASPTRQANQKSSYLRK